MNLNFPSARDYVVEKMQRFHTGHKKEAPGISTSASPIASLSLRPHRSERSIKHILFRKFSSPSKRTASPEVQNHERSELAHGMPQFSSTSAKGSSDCHALNNENTIRTNNAGSTSTISESKQDVAIFKSSVPDYTQRLPHELKQRITEFAVGLIVQGEAPASQYK